MWTCRLFWVNSASVKDAILARVDGVKKFSDQAILAVVLDIEGTNQIDTTTVDMLDSLLAALRERCIDLYLVRVMYPVRIVLRRAGFVAKIGEDHMWHSISQGTREARIHYGLKNGVVDAAGGYDSAAEEHEERIVPRYFADSQEESEDAGSSPRPEAGRATGHRIGAGGATGRGNAAGHRFGTGREAASRRRLIGCDAAMSCFDCPNVPGHEPGAPRTSQEPRSCSPPERQPQSRHRSLSRSNSATSVHSLVA